jgi:hypothetical protein
MSAFILHDRYFDPDTGRISSYFCQLFVLIGQESLQYCILDTEKSTFIALADYRLPAFPKTPEIFYSQVGQLISEEERLLKKYPSVVIGIDTPWHTLVPTPLYDTGQMTKYLEFNFRLPDGCQVSSDRIEEIDAFNIYGFPPGLEVIIRKYFREAALVHHSSALIKAINQYHQINPEPLCIFLHARDRFIDLAFFDGNRPAFFNSFLCRSKEDILYFTLYTIEQLKLRPDSVHLSVTGMIDAGSDSYLLLKQYIGTISFTGRLSNFNYSPLLDQVPSHRYHELFAIALCGS